MECGGCGELPGEGAFGGNRVVLVAGMVQRCALRSTRLHAGRAILERWRQGFLRREDRVAIEERTEDGAALAANEAERRDRRSLNVAAAVLFAIGVLTGIASLVLATHTRHGLARENELLRSSERLLSTMKDLETGERGYVLTGRPEFLEPYRMAEGTVDGDLRALDAEAGQKSDLDELVMKKRDFAAMVIAARKGSFEAATGMVATGQGKAVMDGIRVAVAKIQQGARQRIAGLEHRESLWEPVLEGISAVCVVLAFLQLLLLAVGRLRAERASAALLSRVMENAPVGLGLIDAGLRVRHMNQALLRMMARPEGVKAGEGLWTVLPESEEQLAPAVGEVLEKNRAVTGLDVHVADPERPARGRDLQLGFFPLPEDEKTGASGGAGLVALDVTQQRTAENKLRVSEERFRSLIQSSASMIWTTTAEGKLIGRQTSWMAFTGQTDMEYLDFGWLNAVHPDDRERSMRVWSEAIEGNTLYSVDHRVRRADGAWRYMSARAVPLSEDGVVREWIGMHIDVTEQKEAEEQLSMAKESAEAANRAKSQFLANMSHELRTPLSAVIGYSELLEEEMEDGGDQALLSDVRKIQSNARHLLSLINDVLDLSKIEAERMTTYAEDFSALLLVQDVANTMKGLTEQKGNELVLEAAADLGEMHTDQVKLRQCLFNLIGNAAKFTEHGRITLRATRVGEELRFSVTDSGIGMTEEQRAKLFERFAQADDSTTRKFGGTGLGLAITRAFCRLLGGDIQVTSVYGEGSTFTINVPAVLAEKVPQQLEASAEPDAGKQLVLVIDDDASQRELLTRFLEREGFSVEVAADGKRGLEMAQKYHPRAILLDVMMPQMDGWAVLTALKADPQLETIPVVMVTFVNEPGLSEYLGAADTVLKPVEWDHLKQVMDRFQGEVGDILVVDDDPDARARMRTVLQHNGWTVAEAENGLEALEMVAHAPPRLILLDLTMPVMDGFSFLHALRERPSSKDIPVVVLTARDLNAAERTQLEGADRVLSKGQTDLRLLAGELRALTPALPDLTEPEMEIDASKGDEHNREAASEHPSL